MFFMGLWIYFFPHDSRKFFKTCYKSLNLFKVEILCINSTLIMYVFMKKKTFNMNVLLSFKNMFKWGGPLNIKWNNPFGYPNHIWTLQQDPPNYTCNRLKPTRSSESQTFTMGSEGMLKWLKSGIWKFVI